MSINMHNSSDIWTGKASDYDQVRPVPPPVLLDLLTQMIHTPRPELVVDLGSGTGLSTVIWGEVAERVIGIEPNTDMREEAVRNGQRHPYAERIEYQEAFAQQIGLPDACVDIVTAAQSFHWMEPTATLAEIARILRPGGLFAAYDYDTPPATVWEVDQLAQEMTLRMIKLAQQRGLPQSFKIWPKNKTLDPLRESGHFRFTREVLLHHVEQGDAERYLAMMQSSAFSNQLQFTEQEIGLDNLKQAVLQYIGVGPVPWYISYRIRIGVK
jgi:ubiquinone/menaquinone biosynthesis C-methylase UbiE